MSGGGAGALQGSGAGPRHASAAVAAHLPPAYPERAPWGTASKLRAWQQEALDAYLRSTPQDFLAFRSLLTPASGFQSAQFREIEFLSGLKDRRYLRDLAASRFLGLTSAIWMAVVVVAAFWVVLTSTRYGRYIYGGATSSFTAPPPSFLSASLSARAAFRRRGR